MTEMTEGISMTGIDKVWWDCKRLCLPIAYSQTVKLTRLPTGCFRPTPLPILKRKMANGSGAVSCFCTSGLCVVRKLIPFLVYHRMISIFGQFSGNGLGYFNTIVSSTDLDSLRREIVC